MIYICTHLEKPAYDLSCDCKIVDNNDTTFPDNIASKGNMYRHLRGVYNIYKNYKLEDEVGIFQNRRRLSQFSIPEGYRAVVGKPFCIKQMIAQYSQCHHAEDIMIVKDIVNEPEFDEYLYKSPNYESYYDNMFIMNKQDFCNYCDFLFKTLFKFDEITGGRHYEEYQEAVNAFLGERIGSYWIWKNIPKNELYLADRIQYPKV